MTVQGINDGPPHGRSPLGEPFTMPNLRRRKRARRIEVLIVEDNRTDVDLLRTAFVGWLSEVRLSVVEDGEQAMAYLFKQGKHENAVRPDFIMLDLNLPRKNGIEVLMELKNHPDLKQIPVVVLTTSDRDEDVKAAYKTHANCYVTKSVDVFEFFGKIKMLEEFWLTAVRLPSDDQTV